MKQHLNPFIKQGVLIIAVALLASACQPSSPKLTPQEQERMNKLTETMTPRCLGRYLIDLLVDMKLSENRGTVIDNEIWVEVKPMGKLNFMTLLKKRELEIRAEHRYGRPDQPSLKEIIPVEGGQVFNRAESGSSSLGRTLELHAWRDGYTIKIWVNATDMDLASEYQKKLGKSLKTNVAEKKSVILDIFSRLRGRADNEVPTEPGLCIANGFIRGPAGDGEDISMNFVSSSMPDVYLHVESDSGIKEENTLLERGREIKIMIEGSQGRTVRKGARKTDAVVAFEEWLIAGNTNERIGTDYVKGHFFTLEGNSKTGSAQTPLFNIDFHNGERESEPNDGRAAWEREPRPELKQASLSEAEAVTLWDAITSTLRPRPGAF